MTVKYWDWAIALAGIGSAIVAGGVVYFLSEKNRIEHPEMTDEEYVVFLYSTLLHRKPDIAGFNNQVAALKAGVPRSEIWRNFINSSEFRSPWIP